MSNSSGTAAVFADVYSSFELPKVSSANNQESGKEVNLDIKSVGKKASVSTMKTTTTPTKSKLSGNMNNRANQRKSSMNFELNVPFEKSNNKNDNSMRDENSNYQFDYKDNSKPKSSRKRNIALNVNLAFDVDDSDDNRSNQSTSIMENSDATPLMIDQPSSIKVAVRMRPLSDSEKKNQKDGKITDVLIKENKVMVPYKKEVFEFDHCLDSSNSELFNFASQEFVFRKVGKPQLDYAFQGYNVCLFAYGQSGSGKTYTMMGTEDNPGIIPRFINELFRRINQIRDKEFIVNISFFEIYNEKIHDLLADEFESLTRKLRIREHPQTGPYVEDLTVSTVESSENAMELLKNGLNRRKIASTNSNETSNRSHTIFNIILVQNKILNNGDEASDVDQLSCISKINLVDLAGSERIGTANTDRFREGTMINKSLLTLGKVITQLAENNGGHIPYRESMLTYLLKDSLGGNSRTSMIATISPAKIHLEETLSTLRYASKAQKIINIVRINEDPKAKIIDGLLRQISFLKKEVIKSKNESDNSDSSERSSPDGKMVKKQDTGVQSDGKIHFDETSEKIVKDLKQELSTLVERQKQILNEIKNWRNISSKNVIQGFAKETNKSDHNIIDILKSFAKTFENEDLLIGKTEAEKLPEQNAEIEKIQQKVTQKKKIEDKIAIEKNEKLQQQKVEVKSIRQTECKYIANEKADIVEDGDGECFDKNKSQKLQNPKNENSLNDFLKETCKMEEKKSDKCADEKLSINPKEQKVDIKSNLKESNDNPLADGDGEFSGKNKSKKSQKWQNQKNENILNDFLKETSKIEEEKSDIGADEKLSINPKEQKVDIKSNVNESNDNSLVFEDADDKSLASNEDSDLNNGNEDDDDDDNRKNKKGKKNQNQNQQPQNGKKENKKNNKKNKKGRK